MHCKLAKVADFSLPNDRGINGGGGITKVLVYLDETIWDCNEKVEKMHVKFAKMTDIGVSDSGWIRRLAAMRDKAIRG